MSLHYFEKFFDNTNRLKRATYNVFDLTEDFIYMLRRCGLVIPNVKTKLINRISKFKQHVMPVQTELASVENFDAALREIKETTKKRIKEFNEGPRQEFFAELERQAKRMNDEYEAQQAEFERRK